MLLNHHEIFMIYVCEMYNTNSITCSLLCFYLQQSALYYLSQLVKILLDTHTPGVFYDLSKIIYCHIYNDDNIDDTDRSGKTKS